MRHNQTTDFYMQMTNKEKYSILCQEKSSEIPLFSRDWWLDVVAGTQNWDALIYEKKGKIIAALPIVKKRKYGFNLITMPVLTQNVKLWISYPKHQKGARRLGLEKECIRGLFQKMPKISAVSLKLHHSLTNHLPFYWQGYSQATRYTYILNNIKNHDRVWENFRENIRGDIKKAENRFHLKVVSTLEFDEFYEVNKLTFKRQGIEMPYSLELSKGLDEKLSEKKCRKIFAAIDNDQKIHAAIYIVWDEDTAYYLMGGGDPKLRNSGATSLLMWTAIKELSKIVDNFDFEGSMIESVERFFRSFGAEQTPYFALEKINSKIIKARRLLQVF